MSRFEHYGVVVTPEDFQGADWIGLCRRYGLKTLGIHSGGGKIEDVLTMLGRYGSAAFREEAAAVGLECEYECHAAASLLQPSLMAKHPDYFAFDLRRRARRNDSNWCVTNPQAQALYEKNARELVLALESDTHRYLLWNADSPRIYCHCPECAKLSPSDQAMLATNLLARAARSVDPQATVPYLAYQELMEPPTVVKPESNVFLEFAPIERCYMHAITDDNCATNRRTMMNLKRMLDIFPAATTHMLEYYLDVSLFSNYRRPAVEVRPSKEVMDSDFDFYASLGIRSMTTFAVFMDGSYFRNYGQQGLDDYAEIINK